MANKAPILDGGVVTELRRTCRACPSQWEGKIGKRGSIYIRYRWGWLRVWKSDEVEAWRTGRLVFEENIGGPWDGFLKNEEMQTHLADGFRFEGSVSEEWE